MIAIYARDIIPGVSKCPGCGGNDFESKHLAVALLSLQSLDEALVKAEQEIKEK